MGSILRNKFYVKVMRFIGSIVAIHYLINRGSTDRLNQEPKYFQLTEFDVCWWNVVRPKASWHGRK